MVIIRNIIIVFSFVILISSCSKEEDEIPLVDPGVSSSDFDLGYIGIRLEGSNTMVDSIIYRNLTKGFSFSIPPSQITFIQGDTAGLLTKAILNGNIGDDVSCCLYLNTATKAGVSFKDTIPLDPYPIGRFCQLGKY